MKQNKNEKKEIANDENLNHNTNALLSEVGSVIEMIEKGSATNDKEERQNIQRNIFHKVNNLFGNS